IDWIVVKGRFGVLSGVWGYAIFRSAQGGSVLPISQFSRPRQRRSGRLIGLADTDRRPGCTLRYTEVLAAKHQPRGCWRSSDLSRCNRLLMTWQADRELSERSRLALHCDRAAVLLRDDVVTDRQS